MASYSPDPPQTVEVEVVQLLQAQLLDLQGYLQLGSLLLGSRPLSVGSQPLSMCSWHLETLLFVSFPPDPLFLLSWLAKEKLKLPRLEDFPSLSELQ